MRPRLVTVPFGLVGSVGGGLFASLLREGRGMVAILVACTTVCAIGLAHIVERTHSANRAMLVTIFGAPVAGAVNGALTILIASIVIGPRTTSTYHHLGYGMLGCAILGAIVSIFFVLPLALVTRSANAVHARIGSIAWDSQRRRVLRVAATCSVVAAWIMPSTSRYGVPGFATIALAVVLVLIAITDWDALRKLVTIDDQWKKHQLSSGESVVDLGVGDELWARASVAATYRADSAPFVVWGDEPTARAILRESWRIAQLAALAGVACLALRLVLFA
jgi:hypothetical protein